MLPTAVRLSFSILLVYRWNHSMLPRPQPQPETLRLQKIRAGEQLHIFGPLEPEPAPEQHKKIRSLSQSRFQKRSLGWRKIIQVNMITINLAKEGKSISTSYFFPSLSELEK